ncbi:hypothetical protein [Alteromonas sp. C1M14]|uniref:hypothetical protein n=1 Tax=Alteromonas sp. C1M14 TaxID=2841567 RepID=UPI001C09D8ED|nr:hypothetical protein [Alteromonas sp. C1M14]MBU2979275.1 hypothetical protein [Alteromonas sp. C1M14]
MTFYTKHKRGLAFLVGLSSSFFVTQVSANGVISEHVNNLHEHLSEYGEEVTWLTEKFAAVVDDYAAKGKGQVDTNVMIDYWEEVDFHSAIETQYVPVYASIWQGIYGVKQAIDKGADISAVRAEQSKLNQALWQGLGAVKLASEYQKKGLVAEVKTTEVEPTTAPEIIDDIKKRLDRVVAKYAEQLSEVATTLVHDTYLQRFEGIEGDLIGQDASLVEDLEKDFNVTLPLAISQDKGVDAVRAVVDAMQGKLDKAQVLLEKAEENRKSVF